MRKGFKLVIILLVVAVVVMLVGPTLLQVFGGSGGFDPG